MKRAFTLIELLVVIAIIAILAAILFPVFAQAKASAKSAASLSNLKQVATSSIMYSSDYDDTFCPSQNWNNRQSIGGYSVTTSGKYFNTWRVLLYPYGKNVDLYEDPVATKSYVNSGFAAAPQLNKVMYTQYGMNYMFMGPIEANGGATYDKVGISATRPANPASTVYFVQQYSVWVDSSLNFSGNATTEWRYYGMVEAPDCYGTPANLLCLQNWGAGSAFGSAGLNLSESAGGLSGGVAPRHAGTVLTTFADGHAKKLSLGALAAGTNWSKTTSADSVGVIASEKEKYLWDLE